MLGRDSEKQCGTVGRAWPAYLCVVHRLWEPLRVPRLGLPTCKDPYLMALLQGLLA